MADGEVFNIQPYLIFRCCFGYFYNFFGSSNVTRYALKVVYTMVCVFIVYVSTICDERVYGDVGLVGTLIQYTVNVVCSHYTEDEYILEYYRYNALIDDKRKKRLYTKLKIFHLTFLIFLVMTHVVFYCAYLFFDDNVPCNGGVEFYFMGSIRLAMNVGRVPVLSVFGLLYCRVQIFCRKVCRDLSKYTDSFICNKYVQTYVEISNSLEKTDCPLKLLMFTQLSLVIVDITNVQYKMITDFSIIFGVISCLHLVCNMVVMFPVFIMELISEEIDKMRIKVADRMITCTDVRQRQEYWQFLQCLRQQPMKYVIWRAFEMDARLLLSYLSILVTYIICVLQFKPFLGKAAVKINSTTL